MCLHDMILCIFVLGGAKKCAPSLIYCSSGNKEEKVILFKHLLMNAVKSNLNFDVCCANLKIYEPRYTHLNTQDELFNMASSLVLWLYMVKASNSWKKCLSVLSDQPSFIGKCVSVNLNTKVSRGKAYSLTPNACLENDIVDSPFLVTFR